MIKITVEFTDGEKFEQLIRYIEDNMVYGEAQEAMRVLGHHCADNMKENINSSRKRPDKGTHNLENVITAETLNTVGGIEVGVGRIETLKAEAPYFEVLDVGGYIPNNGNFVPLGSFIPGEPKPNAGNFREGNWEVGGKFTFKPKRAIEGINYIGKAILNLDKELTELIGKLGSKILDGMSKD
jgi:hypothetical protein